MVVSPCAYPRRLFRWWVAARGPQFVVEALLEHCFWDTRAAGSQNIFRVARTEEPAAVHVSDDAWDALVHARTALAEAPAETYDASLGRVLAHFDALHQTAQGIFAMLFPSEGLAERVAAGMSRQYYAIHYVTVSVTDPDVAESCLDSTQLTPEPSLELVARLGPAAEAVLWRKIAASK
jgi:hypothetical protein